MSQVDSIIDLYGRQLEMANEMVVSVADKWPESDKIELVKQITYLLRCGADALDIFVANEESLRRLRDEAAKREE